MKLLFDIGRTKTRLAVAEAEELSQPIIIDTPADIATGRQVFSQTAQGLLAGHLPTQVVGGLSRAVWPDQSWADHLAQIWPAAQIKIANDSAVVGLGEAVYGAGRGFDIVAYITVSTGVGGARIVAGQIDKNFLGFEPGHQFIPGPTWPCPSGDGSNHLESLISGAALEARTGQKPFDIKDAAVWTEQAKYLALGLANTIVHWSPEAVVIGGSMMKQPGIDLTETKDFLNQSLQIYPKLPQILPAGLSDIGGLYGALALSQK